MTNISQMKPVAPTSRLRAAILGAAVTVLGLIGGLLLGYMVGFVTFGALEGRLPESLTYMVAAFVASASALSGSALWGVGMSRLARSPMSWRVAWAGMLGFMPITLLLSMALQAAEPIVFQVNLPLHRLFTLLFVPMVFLISGASSLALGWAVGWGRAAPVLALRVGVTAALAFLAVDLGMEVLGWQVGGPGAEERATMLTVLFASNLGAAFAGGAVLGLTLTQPV
jgi:hypothetical protein